MTKREAKREACGLAAVIVEQEIEMHARERDPKIAVALQEIADQLRSRGER